MGTRTWSRKGVLTAAGRRRQSAGGVNAPILDIWGEVIGDDEDIVNPAPPPIPVTPPTPTPVAPTGVAVPVPAPRTRRSRSAPPVPPPVPTPTPTPTGATPLVSVEGGNPQGLRSAVDALSTVPLDRSLRYEQLILVDGNNNEIARVDGDRSSASESTIPDRTRSAAKYLIHNHPSPVPFSPADLGNVILNGRRGIEARGKPVSASERKQMNAQFTAMRKAFDTAMKALPAKSTQAAYMRDMVKVIDEWLANPNALQWKYMAINDNPKSDFRLANSVDITVKKQTKDMVQLISLNPEIAKAYRAFATDRRSKGIFNTAMTIVVQSVANANALRGTSYTIGTFFE